MKNKTQSNPKGAGRPKLEKKTFPVRCHPKVIIDVRKYAKEKSEEYDKDRRNEIDRASKD